MHTAAIRLYWEISTANVKKLYTAISIRCANESVLHFFLGFN